VLDNFEQGAVIRTISSEGDYNFYDTANSIFSATIEEHDTESGALMQNVEIYVSLYSGSEALIANSSTWGIYNWADRTSKNEY
jgi:hypothetical protein